MPSERNIRRIVLTAFFFSGSAALVYEVVWTRTLSLVLGSTVYALSTMLATFMAGLAIGAYIGGKLADRGGKLLLYFGLFEVGIGLFGLVTVPVIYNLQPVYAWIYRSFHLNPAVFYVLQFILCGAVMIVPTTLMGATFPVVSRRITGGMQEMGRMVGDAYSANTVGAIVGSIAAGFLMVPALGLKWSSFAAGTINLITGFAVIVLSGARPGKGLVAVSVLALSAGMGLSYAVEARYPVYSFYHARSFMSDETLEGFYEGADLVFEKDYAEGRVRAYRLPEDLVVIQVGGKIEGGALKDIPHAVMLAALPAAAFEGRLEDTLVIGLGNGYTAWSAAQLSENVEVVEINPGVVEAVRRFSPVGPLDGIEMHMTDGRRFLSYSDRKYDVITSGPSVPSESVVANLFSKEFYETAASRLRENGVFCQWIPAWTMKREEAMSCFLTFASVFENVEVWFISHSEDFVLLGSKQPFGRDPVEVGRAALGNSIRILPQKLKEMMARIVDPNLERVFETVYMGDVDDMQAVLGISDAPLIVDDRPLLEFVVARNILLGREFRKMDGR